MLMHAKHTCVWDFLAFSSNTSEFPCSSSISSSSCWIRASNRRFSSIKSELFEQNGKFLSVYLILLSTKVTKKTFSYFWINRKIKMWLNTESMKTFLKQFLKKGRGGDRKIFYFFLCWLIQAVGGGGGWGGGGGKSLCKL